MRFSMVKKVDFERKTHEIMGGKTEESKEEGEICETYRKEKTQHIAI